MALNAALFLQAPGQGFKEHRLGASSSETCGKSGHEKSLFLSWIRRGGVARRCICDTII